MTIDIDNLTASLVGLLGQSRDGAEYLSLRPALGEHTLDWEPTGDYTGWHNYWENGISLTFRERFCRLQFKLVEHGHICRGRYKETLPYNVNSNDKAADVLAKMPVPPLAIEHYEKFARIFKSNDKHNHLYFEISELFYDFEFDGAHIESLSISLIQGEGNIFECFRGSAKGA